MQVVLVLYYRVYYLIYILKVTIMKTKSTIFAMVDLFIKYFNEILLLDIQFSTIYEDIYSHIN